MTTKTLYIAADGTEFDTEAECIVYETVCGDDQRVVMCDADGSLTDDLGSCVYAYIKDDEAGKAFYQMNEENGLSADGLDPEGADGFYMWNEYDDMWHYLSPADVVHMYKAAQNMGYLA